MSYFHDIYLRRLNRYGLDYQSRKQNQREKEFELYLKKTVYLVDFIYDGDTYEGSLERYKQDETQILQYLLTRRSLNLPNGAILEVTNQEGTRSIYMVYWKEEIQASGYNKYAVIKMTHILRWRDRLGCWQETFAYMYGQEDNMLKDELRSRSRSHALYTENLKMSFFIVPTNSNIRKDNYFVIGESNILDPNRELDICYFNKELIEGYRVTGFDYHSTPGVEYVTVDPVYLRDETPPPQKTEADSDEDFYWLDMEGPPHG